MNLNYGFLNCNKSMCVKDMFIRALLIKLNNKNICISSVCFIYFVHFDVSLF